MASPRTRGSTRGERLCVRSASGFPAHAGIDPCHWTSGKRRRWLPRARGDRPLCFNMGLSRLEASPRTRGSTWVVLGRRRRFEGFPAHAGIDPPAPGARRRTPGLPRARGDRPATRHVLRAVGEASPRTRGSTAVGILLLCPSRGFPAHAGIDLACGLPGP